MSNYATDALTNLDLQYARQRKELEEKLELVGKLPTNGVVVTFIGEDGWDKEGKAKPPVEKKSGVVPHLIYGMTAYKIAKHVGYKAPDGSNFDGGQGESTSSKYRDAYNKAYVKAVLEAYRPYMIDAVAVKGSRYCGTVFPSSVEFNSIKDYEDAKLLAVGRADLVVNTSVGECHYTSGSFGFYARLPEVGLIKVDIDVPGWHMIAPRPHGITRCCDRIDRVDSWHKPKLVREPVWSTGMGRGDDRNRSASHHYLFATIEDALFALGFQSENV